MATANFYSNSNPIYAIETDEFWESSELDYIEDWVEENKPEEIQVRSSRYTDNSRNYPLHPLFEMCLEKQFGGLSFEKRFTVGWRAGYYDGINLDYEESFLIEGDTSDIEDIKGVISYHFNKGLDAIHSSRLEGYFNSSVLEDFFDVIGKTFTQPLGVTARFSNGETMYHAIQ